MEHTYLVTPEMRGLSWPHVLRFACIRSAFYFLAAILFSTVSNGNWARSIVAAGLGATFDFALTLSVRFDAPQRLRVTDDSIEEIDGPIIRKNEVLALNEQCAGELQGLEVVGRRTTSWLPKYRIFIPASVEELTSCASCCMGGNSATGKANEKLRDAVGIGEVPTLPIHKRGESLEWGTPKYEDRWMRHPPGGGKVGDRQQRDAGAMRLAPVFSSMARGRRHNELPFSRMSSSSSDGNFIR